MSASASGQVRYFFRLTEEEEDTLLEWLKSHDEINMESSNAQNEHPKKWDEINDFSNAQNGLLKTCR